MKIVHHFSRFSTFFKESSLFMQATIVVSGIALIAGTTTVAAMVAAPKDNNTSQSVGMSGVKSQDIDSSSDTNQAAHNQDKQPSDATEPAQTSNNLTGTQGQQAAPQQQAQPENTQPQPTPEPTYTDSYPVAWKNECGGIDTWGMSKCYSASYTAWKVQETFGSMPAWGMGGQNGDPKNWPAKADAANIPRGTAPKVHSVGIQTSGVAGWSVWVEAVNSDKITISYYNFNNDLKYGLKKDVPASSFITYIYFGEQ